MAVAVLGAATAGLAGMAAIQLAATDRPSPLRVLPFAGSFDAAARAALGHDRVQAGALTQAALRIKPTDDEAWLRLAILEEKGGRLSPKGLDALTKAYAVAPYHPGLLAARTAFAYQHWTQLPTALQAQVSSEVTASWPIHPLRKRLFDALQSTRDPRGRIQLALALFNLKMADVAEQSGKEARARGLETQNNPSPQQEWAGGHVGG